MAGDGIDAGVGVADTIGVGVGVGFGVDVGAGVGVGVGVGAASTLIAFFKLSGVRAVLDTFTGVESPREMSTESSVGRTWVIETSLPAFSVMEPTVLPSMTRGIWVSTARVPGVVAKAPLMTARRVMQNAMRR